jgi:hypothetical protein
MDLPPIGQTRGVTALGEADNSRTALRFVAPQDFWLTPVCEKSAYLSK